jgi:hypothetical protein
MANSITHLSPVVAPPENSEPNQTEETAKTEEDGKQGENSKPAGESGY